MLLVVEDAHWLDTSTCDVLAFVARRLESEPIALLFAARNAPGAHVNEIGLPELRLAALDDGSAQALLAVSAPAMKSDLRRRVLEEAGGNALALIELPRALAEDPSDAIATAVPLPLTERLERAFADRLSDLPTATRSILLVAALDEGADLDDILAAASLLESGATSLVDIAPAEAAGLASINGRSLRFRHPLVRAAIYQAAAASDRQTAHRALAETLVADPDRSVWHRAAALTGPDETVAAELETTAERALARGALPAAVAALERAALVSVRSADRGRLLVRAAEIEFELGRTEVAIRHMNEAKPLELGQAERTRLTLWLEAFNPDSWSGAARVAAIAETANKITDPDVPALALRSLRTVAISCWWGNPTQDTRDLVIGAAERLQAAVDNPDILAVLAAADPVRQGALVNDRISRMPADFTDDPAVLHIIGTAATCVWAFDLSWGFLSAAVDGLREQGRLGLLAQALVSQAWAAIHLAKETLATSAADEAGRLARETGQLRWALAADLAKATVAGEHGDVETASALADQAEAELLPFGAQPLLSLVQFSRGRYAVAHQLYSDGFEHLSRILDPSDVAHHPFVGYWALADLIEAAIQVGRLDVAKQRLEELESVTAQTSASYLRATLGYVRPLLAADGGAEALYQAALERDLSSWPCYRGRMLLAYGRWLRRQRRVAESRAPLRAAQSTFDGLAFDGLAEIARQELRASGETSSQRSPDARDRLSPQEMQIAQLAAQGLSNREIGQRLFLSHRTVGAHLYRMFPKLGVTSRNQLSAVLASGIGSPT
jgi:DNA-binding CsgD family transcriptional regulator